MTNIKFNVLSRAQAEDERWISSITEPFIVISINESEDKLAKIPFNEKCMNILPFVFHDIDQRHEQYSETLKIIKYILFTEEMATQILDFVEDMVLEDLVGAIIVHCTAGVSRSRAVAAALSKILNNEDDVIFKGGSPNMLVYKTILERFFLEDNFHLRWPEIYRIRESNLKPI